MMNLPTLLAADVAEKAHVSDALPHLLGFVVVVVTLMVLWGICAAVGMVMIRVNRAAEVPVPVATPAPVVDDGSIPPEILVVIAAAAAAATGQRRRIISIQAHDPTWSQAGRQTILSSHNIR